MRAPWSLQRRLVAGIVALLAVIAVAIGLSTAALLQQDLTQRLDEEVMTAVNRSPDVFERMPVGDIDAIVEEMLRGQKAGALGMIAVTDRIVSAAYLSTTQNDLTLTQEQRAALLTVIPENGPTTVNVGGLGDYRFASREVGPGVRSIIGLPLKEVRATSLQLLLIIALVTGLAILAAAALATAVVRMTLRPLDRVVATAARVSELPLSRGEVVIAERVAAEDTDPRTEVGQMGAALNRLLDHVTTALTVRQRSENKVRQFVSDASHELRTPLAAIRGYAELTRLRPHELPDDVRHSLRRIESESVRMTSLVDDLLLLARLDEGRQMDAKPVDLARLVADAVSDAQAAGRDHTWHLELPEEEVSVLGDRAQLHQVVANLLANARTHTPEGTDVTASVSRTEAGAVVTVVDDGPGIPEELQAHLFERFVRGDRSRSRKAGSTGLGLAIVHAIVEGHGGSVSATSVPGRTTFRVELPAEPPPPDEPPEKFVAPGGSPAPIVQT
jgi:two-component system OmpR family sensor kinase